MIYDSSKCFKNTHVSKNYFQNLDEDYLVLSTVHSAKGQEWDAVFVLNFSDGSFPSEFSTGKPELIEEERRLLYVGITRAQQSLALTYCNMRMKWGQKTGCQASSFIGEIDDKYVEHTTFDDIQNAEMSDDDIDNFFASMNNIFAEEEEG